MRGLLRLILKYHFFLLFIILESISFFLIIQNHYYQKAGFLNSANIVSGYIYAGVHSFTEYLSLKQANKELAIENVAIRNRLSRCIQKKPDKTTSKQLYHQHYVYIPARVINNSVNRQNNHLTLNKGSKYNIKPGMAVISANGIVGIVKNVSNNFSSVISVLNTNLRVSAKIKKNAYYGSLAWDGTDYSKALLNEIPFHVNISVGDTIITSGYSAIFPEGILIGTISEFDVKQGDNFYDISVNLSTNFKNLSYVYIIRNFLKKEQINLEHKTTENAD